MLLSLLLVAFDATHCTRKCSELFSDSPAKLKSCQETCNFNPNQKKSKPQNQGIEIMAKSVVQCINKCNSNITSNTNFFTWSKCRKECLKMPGTNDMRFFDENYCVSHCDRYWKGTVHWKPCCNQCRGYTKTRQRKISENAKNDSSNSPRPVVFTIW